MEVTITDLVFTNTIEIPGTTPLGFATINVVTIDSFVATFRIDDSDFPLHFKPEAIGNRIAHYPTVEEELAAVEALVREVAFHWRPDFEPSDPTNRVHVNGGTDSRITVKWARGTKKAARELLAAHADRIAASITHFSKETSS